MSEVKSLVEALIQEAKVLIQETKKNRSSSFHLIKVLLVDGVHVKVSYTGKERYPHSIVVDTLRHEYMGYASAINSKRFVKTEKKAFEVDKIVDHIEEWIETHKHFDEKLKEKKDLLQKVKAEISRLVDLGIPRECFDIRDNKLIIDVESPAIVREIILKTWGVNIEI